MSGGVMLSEALEAYLQMRRALYAGPTVDNETFVLKRFLAMVGDMDVSELDSGHVDRFFYGPRGVMSPHTPGTGSSAHRWPPRPTTTTSRC